MKHSLHYILTWRAFEKKQLTMGIQYFESLSGENLADHFLGTDGSVNTSTIILQGYWQQPDQYYLTFTQYSIMSLSERFK
jgi:hypothetical protein